MRYTQVHPLRKPSKQVLWQYTITSPGLNIEEDARTTLAGGYNAAAEARAEYIYL